MLVNIANFSSSIILKYIYKCFPNYSYFFQIISRGKYVQFRTEHPKSVFSFKLEIINHIHLTRYRVQVGSAARQFGIQNSDQSKDRLG